LLFIFCDIVDPTYQLGSILFPPILIAIICNRCPGCYLCSCLCCCRHFVSNKLVVDRSSLLLWVYVIWHSD